MLPKGYIYLLRSEDGYCKIGLTKNLKQRTTALKIQLPFPVVLVHKVPILSDLYQAERFIHKRLEKYRMNGEWFKLPDEYVDWFSSLVLGDIDVMMVKGYVRREWVSWEFLCEQEPRLLKVEENARRIGATNYENYTEPFYREIKRQFFYLIGMKAEAPGLLMKSSAAYDMVYFHLLDLTCPNQYQPEEDYGEDYFEHGK